MQYRTRNSGFFSVSNSRILVVIGTVVTLFMAVNLIKAVDENRKIQTRIDKLQSNLSSLQAENTQLTETFEFVQTDLFIEQEARNRLNYKDAGETVVSLPPEKVAVREEIEAEHQAMIEREHKPTPLKWIDYFFASAEAASD